MAGSSSVWWTVALLVMGFTQCQINDPINQQTNENKFYFDSNSDCNSDTIWELYGVRAVIWGYGGTKLGPKSCSIRLKSESQFQGTILNIEIFSMNINDCNTYVSVYDGDDFQLLMDTYDCNFNQQRNRKTMKTSGSAASFIMTRQNVNQWNFDVQIWVTPIRGGNVPGFENDYGTDFYFKKFPQEAIVGMIGGFYLLVILICIGVLIYFYRNIQGKNKAWETHQLATMKTGSGFDSRSHMTQPSNVWSLEMAQGRGTASQYSHGFTDPYPRKHAPGSEDGESGVFRYDDTFQRRRLMNEEKEKEARARYASRNDSYTEPDDHPDNFVEKVITPRVRGRNMKQSAPPSYQAAVSDNQSERSTDNEDESEDSSGDSVGKRPLSSGSERSERSRSSRSETASETESEEESEEESDNDSRRRRRTRARHQKQRPPKSRPKNSSRDGDGPSSSRSGQPPMQQVQPIQQAPYAAYPPGQFVPVLAGLPQFQPVHMPIPHAQQAYPEEQTQPHSRVPQVQPTEPPVYSYLVRRGYTPMDARSNSPASTADSRRSGGAKLEEPDVRLASGVEYMRR